MSLVGNLEDLGLGEILQIVSLSRKTGILKLRSREREGVVVFRNGQVVRASSTTFQQSLGEILIQKGAIDLSTLRKALALQQHSGFKERLGTILIRNFSVEREIVEEVVREQIENVVFALFAWIEGNFEFEVQDEIETVDNTQIDPLQFMLDQGLNPQFLAMEGTRLLDERRYAADSEGSAVGLNKEHSDEIDFDFDLIDSDKKKSLNKESSKEPVVIVDDDAPTLLALSDALKLLGYEVHQMTKSEDALVKIDTLYREGSRPFVVVDLIMPKMDGSGVLGGVELLELLYNNFKDINIVVMTDYHHADAEKKVCGMGYPFIMKPRRVEIQDNNKFQAFITTLYSEFKRLEAGENLKEWHEKFNLGDELRIEMGDDDEIKPLPESVDEGGSLTLLRGMLEELNNPDLQGGVLLLLLRFASEFFNRAVVFLVHDGVVFGAGQFGILPTVGKSGDEKVRSIHFPIEAETIFSEAAKTFISKTFIPDFSQNDISIFEKLGGKMPKELFIGPLISSSKIVGFLYGDNLPDSKPIENTESIAIFLSQAGVAMERNMMQKELHERILP